VTGALDVLLALDPRASSPTWPIWVLPLLFIVWACLRQGVRGGTVVASAAVLGWAILVSLGMREAAAARLQGYFLAQCSTALLVGVSFSWIHASASVYRQVMNQTPVVLYSARFPQGHGRLTPTDTAELTFVSPASRRLLGRAPTELLGEFRQWLRVVHPQDREVVVAAVTQLSRQQHPVTCEYRLAGAAPGHAGEPAPAAAAGVHPENGTIGQTPPRDRWVRDTLVPLIDERGKLQGWEGVLVEITEQRYLADHLRRTSNMLHSLVAHLPAGVFFVQAPGGWPLLVNARARKLLGQREDLAAGTARWPQVYRLYRPDGTPYPAEELPVTKALHRGTTSMCDDIVVHRPDGRRVPLVTWAAPVDLAGRGRPDAAVWVLEDLTALHRAEAARRDSEARLRAVIQTMAEGVMVHDRTGAVAECNQAACDILGLGPTEIQARWLRDARWGLVREDGSPLPVEEHPALVSLRTGQPVRQVILGVPRAGAGSGPGRPAPSGDAVVWLLVNAMPLTEGRDLHPARVVTTFTDISAHRRALAVLRASEEKYRGLIEALPLLLLQSDRRGRLTYVNPAVEALTGFRLAELRSPRSWRGQVHPEDLPRLITAAGAARGGQAARLEVRFWTKERAERVGYVILSPRRAGSEVIGQTVLIADLTAQRRLEHDLQRAQRVELVGRLAGGIAHDLNNLLTVMLGLAEIARGHLPDEHPARSDLAAIAEAGEKAAQLAGQLLALGKKRPAASGLVDVRRMARRTLELLRGTLLPTVRVETALDGPALHVRADETQLQQVVMNLCLNARDAMPEGGSLWVHAEEATRSGGPEGPGGGWVCLSVQDSGHGMAESVRARIFDPFYSTKEHGTGLGLALVREIVESHGGRVEVWSQPGRGARFDVWLPRASEADQSAPGRDEQSRSRDSSEGVAAVTGPAGARPGA
jgi:PAS domain S-box-containing protein